MKNIILLICLVSSLGAYSYMIKIKNFTRDIIEVNIKYGGPLLCGPDQWRLDPGGKINRYVGGCCAKPDVVFNVFGGISSVVPRKVIHVNPPTTGANLSCMNWGAEVSYDTGDLRSVIVNTSDGRTWGKTED